MTPTSEIADADTALLDHDILSFDGINGVTAEDASEAAERAASLANSAFQDALAAGIID